MLSAADFKFVQEFVRVRSGVVLDDEKAYLASSRLDHVARGVGLDSAHEVMTRLRAGRDADLTRRVVEAVTVNETSFFRDLHPFEALKAAVLPDLVTRRSALRRLRIWCAACSTGQEPYSVAMLIREAFPALAAWDVEVFASDLSGEVLARAARGVFTQHEVNRGLPAALLVKYFERCGEDWQLSAAVRKMVTFRQVNLVGGVLGFPAFDLILLRNVLIYFDQPTRKAVLRRAYYCLRPDGYLFLGAGEAPRNPDDGFEPMGPAAANLFRPVNPRPAAWLTPSPDAV